MSNLPALRIEEFSPTVRATYDAVQALKDQIAPKATDAELLIFAQIENDLDLWWHKRQIYLMPYWDSQAPNDKGGLGRYVHRHQVSIEGRRTIAYRTGKCIGNPGPEWTGPREHPTNGPCNGTGEINGKRCRQCPLEWSEVWDDEDGEPYAARSLVYVQGFVVPVKGVAPFKEFAQTYKSKQTGEIMLMPKWAEMPAHMLGKCAESLALRRAFPEVDAAVSYAGGIKGDALLDPDDREILDEADAPDSPQPTRAPNVLTERTPPTVEGPSIQQETSAPPSEPARQARQSRGRPRARSSWEPPIDYYDNLPEAGVHAPNVPENKPEDKPAEPTPTADEDPGRPFE